MVRAAAKNNKDVTIIVNATDYQRVLSEMPITMVQRLIKRVLIWLLQPLNTPRNTMV